MNNFSMYMRLIWNAIKGREQDYTILGIRQAIVLLAIPMILEMLMESLFSIVDIFFVAKLGSDALATVGLTESILMVIYAAGMGISIAATAIVSRRFGEKDYNEAGNATFQLLVTGSVLALLLGGFATYFTPDILALMGATAEVIKVGVNYTRVIFAGNIAIILLFLTTGLSGAQGSLIWLCGHSGWLILLTLSWIRSLYLVWAA